jgi:HrpA-like RNA helicase
MSGLPTLLKPGAVLPQPWMSTAQKNKLSSVTSIDFLIEYLLERAWNKQEPPKIPIKGPGSRVLVLRSGTGTGKSTVIPAYIYTKFFEELNLKKNIICTQPTVVTASDIPYQIVQNYKNLTMGTNIGFQTGSLVRKPVKGVLFATVGILLQHLKLLTDEEFMRKYSYIILDEIHNRSIEVDTTLFYLKNLLDRNYENPECPFIILTSGTFEPEVFMNYFGCPKDAFLDVVGSSHPIIDNFTTFDVSDYISYAVDLIEKIHLENLPDITNNKEYRDIMLFLQGGSQIKKVIDEIHKLNANVFIKGLEYSISHMKEQQKKYTGGKASKQQETYYLCPIMLMSENIQKGEKDYQDLYSDISSVLVDIYEFDDEGKRTDKVIDTVHASRKVIISTNSAETGITIPGLKYCIDSGMVNESQFNPNFGCNILMNKNVTQASSRQRRGRVGRKEPGVFYTCYTKETYDKMPAIPFPDIVKADATGFVLDVILSDTETKLEEVDIENVDNVDECFQMNQFDQRWYKLSHTKPFDVKKLNFIQYPAADSLSYAVEKLHGLGFIDHEYKPTLFGYLGSKFRKVDIENVRMILGGYQHGANILDLITIACFLQAGHKLGIKKNKYVPRNILDLEEEEAMMYFTKVIADEFIEYLFIWDDYMSAIDDLDKLVGKYVESAGGAGKKSTKKTTVKTVSKTDPHYIRSYLRKWAEQNGFSYDVLVKITMARDEMIADLLNIGINPYHNGLGLPRGKYNLKKIIRKNLAEGLSEIQKIKQSIYEGYRFNLYTWDQERNSYVSAYGNNPVTLDSKIVKAKELSDKPKNIVLASCMLQPSSTNPGMYDFIGGDVSVLDGYVDPDYGYIFH